MKSVLYAFYDLGISPVTFDIIQFLVLAEAERRKLGCDSLHVVFVPGPRDGFSPVEVSVYRKLGQPDCDADLMRWRLRNILVPLCWMIPSCRQLTVCSLPAEAMVIEKMAEYIFPKGYTVLFPKEAYSLFQLTSAHPKGYIQATPQAKRFVAAALSRIPRRKIVTISLRNCPYQSERNSNIEAWAEFIESLDLDVYYPIVVNDTWAAFKPLPPIYGLRVFEEVSWNMELRVALYELSYLNLSVSCGPFMLCVFNSRTRYLMFKMLSQPNLERFFRSEGLEPGSQYEHAESFQRIVWKDDTLPVIREEFDKMCDKIDNGG